MVRSESHEEATSPIRAFYRHRSVLITCPNEFWAKLAVLKLLQTCEVTYIYVLMRPKRSKTLQDVYDDYMAGDIFENIRDSELLKRVIPIAAVTTVTGLGLRDIDLKLLAANVSVIFHSTDTNAKLNRSLKYV